MTKKKGLLFFSMSLSSMILFVPAGTSFAKDGVPGGGFFQCTGKESNKIIHCDDFKKYKEINIADPSQKEKLAIELLRAFSSEDVRKVNSWNVELLNESINVVQPKLDKHFKNMLKSLYRIAKNDEEFEKFKKDPILYLKKHGSFPFAEGEFLPGKFYTNADYLAMGEDVRARYKNKEIPVQNNFGYIGTSTSSSLAASHTESNASFSTGSLSESRTEYGYTTHSASMAFGGDRLRLKLPHAPPTTRMKITGEEPVAESHTLFNAEGAGSIKEVKSVMFNTEELMRLKK